MGRWRSWQGICYTSVRTRVWLTRTHIKSHTVRHACNPSAPMAWLEIGQESPLQLPSQLAWPPQRSGDFMTVRPWYTRLPSDIHTHHVTFMPAITSTHHIHGHCNEKKTDTWDCMKLKSSAPQREPQPMECEGGSIWQLLIWLVSNTYSIKEPKMEHLNNDPANKRAYELCRQFQKNYKYSRNIWKNI